MENIRGISTFIRIVRTGNFIRAARELGITPQAASVQIKQLENWVGVRLLNRSTRKVSLTEEGASFYQTCVTSVGAIDDEVERMRNTAQLVFGNLRLAAPVGMVSRFVVPALVHFLDMYPRVSVDLLVHNRVSDGVGEQIDVGILPHPLPNAALISRWLVTAPFMLCASPAYLRRHGKPQLIEDLERHRRIDLKKWIDNEIWPWRFRDGDKIVTSQLRPSMVTNDADSLIEAVLSGAGIGLVSFYRAAPHLRSGRLETVLDGQVVEELSWSIYIQQRNQVPLKVRLLADYLFDVLKTHPDFSCGNA